VPRQSKTPAQMRNAELAKIHIAKKDLGLDDDTYRDILWTICRAKSSADLDSTKRFKLLAHFRHLGWKPTRTKKKKITDPKESKIWSLLYQIRDLGEIQTVTKTTVRKQVEKFTGCSDVRFCTEAQKSHVIECLKQWLARVKSCK